MAATIHFYNKDHLRGSETTIKAANDDFQEGIVSAGQSSVASVHVDSGTWLLYTQNYFMGASYVLQEGFYETPEAIQSTLLSPGEKWTGQIRSYRLVTPASLMLFDNDFYRGERSVLRENTKYIEDSDTKSLVVESGTDPKPLRLDLTFVLDGSASIGSRHFDQVKEFAADMVRDLPIRQDVTRIGLMQYSSKVTAHFKLAQNDDKDSVLTAITNVNYQNGGSTKTGQALADAHTKMDWAKPPVKRVVIVVTDGKAQDDVETPAKALKNDDFVVYAVGVGHSILRSELETIAQDPSKVYLLSNYADLKKIITDLTQSVKQAEEWALYKLGQFKGEKWEVYPGYYNHENIRQHLEVIGSAERLY